MRIGYGIVLFLVAGFVLCQVAQVSAQQGIVYTVGVVPSAPPVDTHTLWSPFIERLSRETGLGFRLKVYEKMSKFEQDISAGGPDIIFASPLQAVVGHKSQGYMPLVRSSSLVSSQIFVRKDSPIRTIDDLSGKKISFAGNKNL